ncbi:hypothetical protein KJ855_00330 [Patescibacteria group bacterium]|nr:hypothetical protein [Patescibacteria group bacterium]
MGLLSFFQSKSPKPKQDQYIVLDIDSNFVTCLIIKNVIEEKKGYITGYARENIGPHHIKHGQILDINSVATKIDSPINQAVQMSGFRPQKVIAGISSPLITSFITKALHNRPKPNQKITSAELQGVFKSIQTSTKSKIPNSDKYELVNAAILQVFIDGHEVKNPLDFSGRQLTINFYASFAPLIQISALQSVFDELKLDLANIIYKPYALYQAFDATSDYQYKNCAIIDIESDITNLTIIQGGLLEKTLSFDYGVINFSKALAKILDVSPVKAHQYLHDYTNDLLAASTESQFNEVLTPIAEDWIDTLAGQMKIFNLPSFPRYIYYCGDGSALPQIDNILKTNWYTEITNVKSLKISRIHPIDIENIVDQTTQVTSSNTIDALALANITRNIKNSMNPYEELVRKFTQALRT